VFPVTASVTDGKLAPAAKLSVREQINVVAAVGVPQLQPGALVIEGLEIVAGRAMPSEVVPVAAPTPALLTVTDTVAEEPLRTDRLDDERAVVRSAAATAAADTDVELLPLFVSPPPEVVEVELMLVFERLPFTVPETTISE
jgi:hypothetical protein